MSQEPPKAIVDFTGFQRADPNHATALVIKLAIQLVDHAQWDDCAGGLVADPADVMDLNDAIYTLPRSIIEAARNSLSEQGENQ